MNPTVGEQLRNARVSKGISIEDVVKATHIRLRFLQELENDHPELLNSPVQARGFLRLYAQFLGLSYIKLLEGWQEDTSSGASSAGPEQQSVVGQGEDTHQADQYDSTTSAEIDGQDAILDEKSIHSKFSLSNMLAAIPKISVLLSRKKTLNDTDVSSLENEPEMDTVSEKISEPAQIHPQTSTEIYNEIGFALRERRLALELTLSDVERFTNVKRMYLNAMETGRFDELPSTVQGRGMLNNYSKFLALDDSPLMDDYARALQAHLSERTLGSRRTFKSPLTVKLNIPEKWRRILNPDLIFGGLFILAMFTFIIWGGAQVLRSGNPVPTEAPSISEVLQQTPSPTIVLEAVDSLADQATPIPGVIIQEATPTQIATVNAAPLQLYIIAHDRAYVNVIVDGVSAFDGRVLPDNVYTYSGQNSIELVSGSGAALEAYFNQDYLGSLGNVGEVVRITFSDQGFSTPTPQFTETPYQDLMEP